jgi:putative ABC transport system permease protein
MLQLALRSVRHNLGRYVATLVAIATGVAFFTATGFLSARVIDALEGDVDRQFGAVDVAVVVDTSDPDASQFAEQLVIPGEVLDAIAEVDGVEAVTGEVSGPVAFAAADGTTFGDGTTGRLWVDDEQLNPLELVEGAAPASGEEIVIDRGLAEDESLAVGDEVTLLTIAGPKQVTVVGTSSFGSSDSIDPSGTVSLHEDLVFDALTDGRVEYQDAFLRTSGDPASVTDAVEQLAPDGFVAQTGDEYRADKREEAGAFGKILKNGLQAFALLALFVGGFVIYNTFSVIIAQRMRELAVLSAIGATPRQLKRSLRFEGLLVGVLGSIIGVAVGAGLAFALSAVLELVGVSLPGSGISVSPAAIVNGIVIGTLITLASVLIPARRAAKIEPIQALREAETHGSEVSRGRKVAAAVLMGLGLLALLSATAPAVIGLGVLLLIVGTIVAGPVIALLGAKVLRPIMGRFGLEGKLAVDNATRSPKRTATTANALLIGVFLVTFVTVAGTSLKDFTVRELNKIQTADFVVASTGGTLDDALLEELGAVDGVASVTPFRRESVSIDGSPGMISTASPDALAAVTSLEATEGSLDDLEPGTIAVAGGGSSGVTVGSGDEPAIGDTVTVANAAGDRQDLTIVAILEPNLDLAQVGDLVTAETFDQLVGDTGPTVALIDAVDGAESDAQDALEAAVASRPDISVSPGNAIGQLIGSIFSFMINAINGLLLMSVVIALIGIVNTLSLSILERRRELGLLRIIGMVDKRVQRMVRIESAIISALGTVTGVVLGLAIGWGLVASINRTADAGISMSFPLPLIGLVLVAGVLLGFLASIIPARRSTRLEVLDAIAAQ